MSYAIAARACGLLIHSIPLCIAAATLLLMLLSRRASAAVGPTGTLYITSYAEFGTTGGLDRVQGVSFNSSSTGNPDDICIATNGDVRTFGYSTTESGSRFDLAGNPLPGGPYVNTFVNSQFHDGTGDGTNNYTVDWPTGQVLRYSQIWGGAPFTMFTVTPMTAGWITMNAFDGTFWLSQYGFSDLVEHRSSTGTLLGSFNSGVNGSQGLALDPLDGTLWMSQGYTLYQFAQTGLPLQNVTYAPSAGQWFGMEFDTTPIVEPEPSSLALLFTGLPLVLRRRR